jgi:5-methylthioadenosine/S-adenosylhomocysteine deaminase
MQADMIQLDITQTGHMPLYDVQSHLVYVLGSQDVQTTIVAGQVLMRDRRVLTMDEQALRAAVNRASDLIRRALREQQENDA